MYQHRKNCCHVGRRLRRIELLIPISVIDPACHDREPEPMPSSAVIEMRSSTPVSRRIAATNAKEETVSGTFRPQVNNMGYDKS
jgi:hypothetical protein